jgi:RNA polymerase sigma-70 factor (ECF subfamily)
METAPMTSRPDVGHTEAMATDFSAVAERVAPRLYRVATRMCRSSDEAQDLVQDTLLQAFRKWEQFEGRADPATWLYTIAGRLCQRRHRLRAGEPRRMEPLSSLLPSPSDPVVAIPASDGNPADTQRRREAEQTIALAISRLPVTFRLPLVLSDIAELTAAEIALVLGLKEATVKTRIHRARLKLRKALLEQLPARQAPPPNHDRQVCLDLLSAKQESLDRRVPFPFSSQELCARCQAVFAALDLGRDACVNIGRDDLPPKLRELLRQQRDASARARHDA